MKTALATVLAVLVAAAPASAATCPQWSDRTVASGFGSLENLEFDDAGGMFLSEGGDSLVRLTPDGKSKAALSGLNSPGGQRLVGGKLFFVTGDVAASGVENVADGTLDTFDPKTGAHATFATGLTSPNGLAVLPSGDFVVSRVLGSSTGITRIPADDPAHPQANWAKLGDTNGLAVDPSGRYLYADSTLTIDQQIRRIDIADPTKIIVVARLMDLPTPRIPPGLDDMTIDDDGVLYVAANLAGEVERVDPKTGDVCVIASGLHNTSSVKFGRGPGWNPTALYATGFDGVVHELTPPKGSAPTVGTLALKARAGRSGVFFTVTSGGLPIAGATVGYAHKRATTDVHGRAKIAFTKPGRRTATASRSGFRSARLRVRIAHVRNNAPRARHRQS